MAMFGQFFVFVKTDSNIGKYPLKRQFWKYMHDNIPFMFVTRKIKDFDTFTKIS